MGSDTEIARVVIAFDGSAPSKAALRVAVAEATSRQTRLHLVCAIDVLANPTPSDAIYSRTAREAAQEATDWARILLGRDRVDTTIDVGAPTDVVLDACKPGDLLVVGSQGHRPVGPDVPRVDERRSDHAGHLPGHGRQGVDGPDERTGRRRHRRLDDVGRGGQVRGGRGRPPWSAPASGLRRFARGGRDGIRQRTRRAGAAAGGRGSQRGRRRHGGCLPGPERGTSCWSRPTRWRH